MSLAYEPANERVQFSFAVEGLSDREELLLKSIIRLLDHRTKHAWVYDPFKADLWIVENDMHVPSEAKYRNPLYLMRTIAVLRSSENVLVEVNGYKTEKAVMRLNAKKIEDVLNEVGSWFDVKLDVASHADLSTAFHVDSYKLVRWPTSLIRGDTSRSKIAALMLGKPLTIADIVNKSSCDMAFCEEFLDELRSANLIETAVVTSPRQTNIKEVNAAIVSPTNKPISIFARIRNRLSLPILGSK